MPQNASNRSSGLLLKTLGAHFDKSEAAPVIDDKLHPFYAAIPSLVADT